MFVLVLLMLFLYPRTRSPHSRDSREIAARRMQAQLSTQRRTRTTLLERNLELRFKSPKKIHSLGPKSLILEFYPHE